MNESHKSLLCVWCEMILTHPETALDIVPTFLLDLKFMKFHSAVRDNHACFLFAERWGLETIRPKEDF